MSKNGKTIFFAAIAAALCAVLVIGINAASFRPPWAGRIGAEAGESGDHSTVYTLPAADVDRIELQFASDDIEIRETQGDEIRIVQSASRPLKESEKMVLETRGSTAFAKSPATDGWFWFRNVHTAISVEVPEGYAGDIWANNVSGRMVLDIQAAEDVQLETVSGAIKVPGGRFGRLDVSSVSGRIVIHAQGVEDLRADSVSGGVEFSADTLPEQIRISTISGSVGLEFPGDQGFELDFDSVSGSLNSDFPLKNNRIYQAGGSHIQVDTVSGGLWLEEK